MSARLCKPGLTVAAFALCAFAASANPRVVVADSPSSEGACPFFTNAAAKAGFDVSVRNAKAEEWESEEAYRDVDVVVFTGGFNDTKFPSGRTRLQLARFAAGGKGVLLSGFRCGPIRNWSRQIFPQVAGSYGSHPLTPWISPVGDSPLAKAFAGETLALAEFDCFGLRVGPDGTPFAKCGDETIAAFGEVGLGRVVVLGAFINTRGMPKRPDLIEAVYAEMLRYLSSGKQGDAAARSKAVAEAEEAFVRRDAIYKYTNDERGTINTQGLIPEMRDGALVPIESRQFLLEHYARTLDDKTLADECRKLAAKAKGVVASIRKAGDAFEARTRKAADGMSVVELAAALADKGIIDIGKCRSDLEAIAKRCPVEPMDALAAKCRAKAREERIARVAAENAEDIKSLASLVSRLSSADSAVRLDAAMELGRIGAATPEVVSALVKALDDADSKVRVQATISLAWMQAKDAVPALLAKLADANCGERLRRRIAQALGQIGDMRAIPALLPLLSSHDRWLRENAILSLGYLKAKEAVPTLVKYANGEDIPEHDGKYTRDEDLMVVNTRECAIRALGMIGDESALPTLRKIADGTATRKKSTGSAAASAAVGISSYRTYGVERLSDVAIESIAAGGLAERGVRQPEALSSREFFYALSKKNNALAGRLDWTYMCVPWFKEEKNRRLLLPYLLDAGFTGFHDAWGSTGCFSEEGFIDFANEADDLGLIAVLPAPSEKFATICDIMKGTQDFTFSRIGANPLYIACWSEEGWPHATVEGRDFDAWLRRKHGDDYGKALGLKAGQTPFAVKEWRVTRYGVFDTDGAGMEGNKAATKYDPGVNSGALRVAALENMGENMLERFTEIQDWLRMRRKAFNMTYSLTRGYPATIVGGQKALAAAGVVGPETYQAAGRGNVFMIESFRNGMERPVMTEFYNMYSSSLAHDLRGFYENAIHSKCYYPFDISHLTPFYGRFLSWGWEKGRWDLFRRVYSHVRDNRELYAVSPSAAKVAIVLSERSFVCARRLCGWPASQEESTAQRGAALLSALSMSHICADVFDIDFADAKKLSKYGVLFLVDAKMLTDREQSVLKEWVANGGTLVCDGATGLFDAKDMEKRGDFAVADLLGVKYAGTDFRKGHTVYAFWPESWANKAVMQIEPSLDNQWLFQSYIWRDFKDAGAVAVASDSAKNAVEYDAVLGISRVDLNGAKAVQTFADGSPALTVNEYGKGKAYLFTSLAPMLGHVSSKYECTVNRYDFWPGVRETYETLAREGMSATSKVQPVDVLNAPDELELTVYEQKDGNRLVVHLLDRDESRTSLDGVSLRINGDRPIKAVYRPGGKPLALAGRTVALGKFDVYDMLVVEF